MAAHRRRKPGRCQTAPGAGSGEPDGPSRYSARMKLWKRSLLLLLAALVFFAVAGIVATWAPDRPVAELMPRWGAPPSRWVPVEGMSVHVRDEGPGAGAPQGAGNDPPPPANADPAAALPIVLLHGTSDSLHTWDGWAQALKSERRVIRFDLPGFGLTGPHPQGDYSIDAYVRFVAATLDALGVPRFVLAGNSLGGQIAWATAHAYPQRVARLVLVDASGYPLNPDEVPIGFRIARVPLMRPLAEHTLPRGLVEQSVKSVYGDPSRVTPALVDRYYELSLREGNRRALGQRLDAGYAGNEAHIRALKLPTLILWGARDRLIPLASGQRFARDIAGARLVVFDELGHVPHQEDPARTLAEVRRFLAAPEADFQAK